MWYPPRYSLPVFHIDDETLRDVVDDRAAAKRRLAELSDRLDSAALGERVVLLRLLGQLDQAEELGWIALETTHGDARKRVTATIRLAHVLQWQQRFDEADAMFQQALDLADVLRDDILRAFAHQHLGKSLYDQARYVEAAHRFRTALRLRRSANAPADQQESSAQALASAQRQRRRARPAGLPTASG